VCEHHLMPFYGQGPRRLHPDRHIVGISKIARLVECYARRLQVQERMTKQIADTLMEGLKPLGVGVVVRAEHLCMRMRGVEKPNSFVVTSALLGELLKRDTRQEFMNLIGIKRPQNLSHHGTAGFVFQPNSHLRSVRAAFLPYAEARRLRARGR
jgi:GTP cyclohydrolase I